MAEYILSVDLGTSSCKVAVFNQDGKVISSAVREYPTYYPAPGYAEQKPGLWWAGFCQATQEIITSQKVSPGDISVIGVTGQSWSAVAVDKSGEVLFDNPIWMDCRAEEACRLMINRVPEEDIFSVCGNPIAPMYTTPKILWFEAEYPETFKRVYKIMQSNSYLVYRMTGLFTQDISQGYGLHFFNIHTLDWDRTLAKSLGICPDLMPDLYPSTQIVGKLTKEAAAETGLLMGTPVIAGGLDAACSALGAGVFEPKQTQAQGGTAGGMSLCLDNCTPHKKLIISPHVINNRWLLQGGTVGGGGALRWLRDSIFEELTYAQMSQLAEQSPPGVDGLVFLPYMSGERSPIWDNNAKGVFFGLDYSKNRAGIIRAVMEGVAFSLLHNLKTAAGAGAEAESLNLVGGIANSPVWLQIFADITEKPIRVMAGDTGTNLGAAILAGIGLGMYENAADATKKTVHIRHVYEPQTKNQEIYQRAYKIYLNLYSSLKGIFSAPI